MNEMNNEYRTPNNEVAVGIQTDSLSWKGITKITLNHNKSASNNEKQVTK